MQVAIKWRIYSLNWRVHLVLFCLISITSCSVPVQVILFNSSLGDIIIMSKKGTDREVVNVVVKVNEQVKITTLLDSEFSIRSQSSIYAYERGVIPISFVETIGFWPFFERVAKAQLESDGCIYLIPVKEELPVHEFGMQPEGFPLCPK